MWGRIISTHALTEGDCHPPERRTLLMKFQLTPSRRATSARVSTDAVEVAFQLTPSRRATHLFGQLSFHILISTHALTEGDHQPAATGSPVSYFNSRPHGGRQHPSADGQSDRNFNSRPHGGRHHRSGHDYDRVEFQLTPSRRATREYIAVSTFATYFNSRPHGGRQLDLFGRLKSGNFNSRPHGGRRQI